MNVKDSYRNDVKHFREQLTEEDFVKKSNIIFDKIISNELYLKADTVLTYVSFNNEVDTLRLIDYSLENSKKVAVPRVDKTTKEMDFYYISSRECLHSGYFGVLEPDNQEQRFEMAQTYGNAVMIVPGLVFDLSGGRIGYGGGFYDKYLSKNSMDTMGVCFKEQLVKEVEMEEHDIRMKLVISD